MARRRSPDEFDASRREFFRAFGKQTVQNAGALAGAAAELRRTSLAAAHELFDVNQSTPGAVATPAAVERESTGVDESFRSAYRYTGDSIVLLDQRLLPGRTQTFECLEPKEVAAAIAARAISPGPILAELAAYAIAMSARQAVDRTEASRDQVVKAGAGSLRAARREVRALTAAVERMEARYDELANSGAAGGAIADGLKAEADAIASEAAEAHAEIGLAAAELIAKSRGGEAHLYNVLLHGDGGPLSCGLIGMATALLQALGERRGVHAWVTAGAPSDEGARVTSYQLGQLDIPHTVIPDTAVAWLLANQRPDAVILRGDAVAANGDTVALIGALNVAQLAQSEAVPVIVLAPSSSLNLAAPDGRGLGLDLLAGAALAVAGQVKLEPVYDLVPAPLVTAHVSEAG